MDHLLVARLLVILLGLLLFLLLAMLLGLVMVVLGVFLTAAEEPEMVARRLLARGLIVVVATSVLSSLMVLLTVRPPRVR